MTDRWSEIEALFDQAVEQPEEERTSWIEQTCDDPEIRAKVLNLLKASARAGGFLDSTADDFAAELIQSEGGGTIARLGAYRITEEIGSGGMGAVYLGERADGQYRKQVAVKTMRFGVASKKIAQRFLVERQILAALNHPNIAKLLDGGVSPEGTPYFVMDFIKGRPIDRYCDETGASVETRLGLFLVVCNAVAYAHRQLIVHRDLKPSNILVTDGGSVKLLDFGIAKLLEQSDEGEPAVITDPGHFPMTPEYASPELVHGRPISTASDIYQLGVLLYKLLTGTLPYRFSNRSLTEIALVVGQEEPVPPSIMIERKVTPTGQAPALRARELRGDLDAIVMKALRKDPEDRYESVERFAEDIRNHLNGRPVAAHAGTRSYRLRKFLRRNRWQVAAVFLFLVLLIGYATTVTVQQNRTERERDRARQYASILNDLFSSANPFDEQSDENAKDITVREVLDAGVERLRMHLADDDEMRSTLLNTVAGVYRDLGDEEKARNLYEEILDLARDRRGERSVEAVEALQQLSSVTRDSSLADSLFRLQLQISGELEGETDPLTARSLSLYGRWLTVNGRFDEGLRALGEAIETLRNSGPDHSDALVEALLAASQANTALNRIAEADTLANEAYHIRHELSGDEHPSTAVIAAQIAVIAENRGDLERAERLKRQTFETFKRWLGDEHHHTLSAANNLVILFHKTGRYREAEKLARQTFQLREKTLGKNDPETIASLQNLAVNLLRQGRLQEAAPLFMQTHERFKESLPADHRHIALPLLSLTDVYLQLEDFKAAETKARAAKKHLDRVLPEGHPLRAVAASRLGEALMRQSRFEEAEALLVPAFEQLGASQGYNPHLEKARTRLVSLYAALDRPEDAARYDRMMSPNHGIDSP